jgi:hypothetical protein
MALAFSPAGDILATLSFDETVRFWDVRRGVQVKSLGKAKSCQPRKGFLGWLARQWERFKEWVTGTVPSISFVPEEDEDTSLAFSPDGRVLALGKELAGGKGSVVQLLDVVTLSPVASFPGHRGPIFSVAFSADGRRLVSGSRDGTLRLWDVAARGELACFHSDGLSVDSVGFAPDGCRLVSVSGKSIRVWSVPEGPLHPVNREQTGWADNAALYDTPGNTPVFQKLTTVRVSHPVRGATIARLRKQSKIESPAAFAPDGSSVVAPGTGCSFEDLAAGPRSRAGAALSRCGLDRLRGLCR